MRHPIPIVLCAVTSFLSLGSTAMGMTVTSTSDTSGTCTLRAAIEAVNTSNGSTGCGPLGSPTTTINVPANTFLLTEGQLVVENGANLKIVGSNPNFPTGTTITAGNDSRVLEIKNGATVELAALTITEGRTAAGTSGQGSGTYGGSSDSGGGILNKGSLTLDHVLVTDNGTGPGGSGANGTMSDTAAQNGRQGGTSGHGGGIFNDTTGVLDVRASTISDNFTGRGGDGGVGAMGQQGVGHITQGGQGGAGIFSGSGGGILNFGTATITTTHIVGNATGRGGNGGTGGKGAGELAGSGGSPPGNGGYGGDGGSNGTTYNPNTGFPQTWIRGGAGVANSGSLTITRSTISGNVAGRGGDGGTAGVSSPNQFGNYGGNQTGGIGGGGGLGGGILINGPTTLTNVTLSGNQGGAGGDGGPAAVSGGLGGGYGGWGGDGAGIWSRGSGTNGNSLFTHVTISTNFGGVRGLGGAASGSTSAGPNGERGEGAGIATGGRVATYGAAITLANSIVANNGTPSDANCVQHYPPNQYVDIADGGGNVTFAGTTCPGLSANPMLGLLGQNGGPTPTMLPDSAGAAIGVVPADACTVAEDQRGFSRGTGTCDAGAVDTAGNPVGPTATTTALISSANPSVVGDEVTYTATMSPPPIGGTVSFTDDGATIDGCGAVTVSGGGQATCKTTYGSASTHQVVAQYAGNFDYAGSTSPTLTQQVDATPPPGGGTGGGSPEPEPPGSAPPGPPLPGPIGGGGPAGNAPAGRVAPLFGRIRLNGATATIPVTCRSAAGVRCVFRFTLAARVARGAAQKKRKPITLGTASATLAAGATKRVPVKLNARGRRLLKRLRRLNVSLTVTERQGGPATTVLKRTLRFRAKR